MNKKYGGLIVLFVSVISIQAITGILIFQSFETMQDRAAVGDMFGVVNTLFSGLAFAGVIYAIILQKEELKLQREELELTRAELSRSADAQQISSTLLNEQLSVMRENYSFEKEREVKKSQPILQNSGGSSSPGEINWQVVNAGATITEVHAKPKNQKFSLQIKYNPHGSHSGSSPMKFDLVFLDALEVRRNLAYVFIQNIGISKLKNEQDNIENA